MRTMLIKRIRRRTDTLARGTSWNMTLLRRGSGLLLRWEDTGGPWSESESACGFDGSIVVGQAGQLLSEILLNPESWCFSSWLRHGRRVEVRMSIGQLIEVRMLVGHLIQNPQLI